MDTAHRRITPVFLIALLSCGGTSAGPPGAAARSLRVEISQIDGMGTVKSEPQDVACRSICFQDFRDTDAVVLTAVPEKGWRFDQWSFSDTSLLNRMAQPAPTMDLTSPVLHLPAGADSKGDPFVYTLTATFSSCADSQPTIQQSTAHSAPGGVLGVLGYYLDPARYGTTITLNKLPVQIFSVLRPSAGSERFLVEARMPQGATSGPLLVSTLCGMVSRDFKLDAGTVPQITDFSPKKLRVGEELIVTGKDFKRAPLVRIGLGMQQFVPPDSDTELTVKATKTDVGTGPVCLFSDTGYNCGEGTVTVE